MILIGIMRRITTIAALCLITGSVCGGELRVITTGTLLGEMGDLGRLARWPDPAYRTIQLSSYDRRSTTAEAPGWFANADGFGGEPIPGFQRVLRQPRGAQAGLFLLAELKGPGAIVRTWSAGMGGVLRVYLDPAADSDGVLIWEGRADDFLRRRAGHYIKTAGVDLDAKNALSQEDADYLPIPFARGLRMTWEGKLNELHFYHVQVRLYGETAAVRSFDGRKDLKEFEGQLRAAVAGLTNPTSDGRGQIAKLEGMIEPGRAFTWSPDAGVSGGRAIGELSLRLGADSLDEALRGCLLRLSFDGSQRPQVEAPVGDFFASGPGVNPYRSLPFSVEADGRMVCRFVMPYEKAVRLEIVNHTTASVRIDCSVRLVPWQWDDGSLHFRAKWRADHDLLAGAGVIDLPYAVMVGKGVFVGCAAMIMNPSGVPTAGGNWWGEGDEKFLVDGESIPSTFGTGSEDYFNYSWSRPDLFAHPYCGQPLDSGPDTAGYVSNHRFQVMDAIPFERSLAALMELWSHNRTPGLSYARIAYCYARPSTVDDHRALAPSDLKAPPLPKRQPQALGAASGAKFVLAEQLRPEATAGRVEMTPLSVATQLHVMQWQAEKGARLKFNLSAEEAVRASIHIVAVHRPNGGVVRVLLEGKALALAGGGDQVRLRSAHVPRVLNVHFRPVELKGGENEIELECIEAGPVGLDYIWIKRE